MSSYNLSHQAREDREQIKRELEDIRACLDRIENLCRSIIYPIRWSHVATAECWSSLCLMSPVQRQCCQRSGVRHLLRPLRRAVTQIRK